MSEIQIEKVMLDGLVLPVENLRLSQDEHGTLIFLLKEAQSLISEPSDLPDITQSPLFKMRQEALQSRLLDAAKSSPAAVPAVPKPAFLTSRVRGEQLTRQQVATLGSGASVLAKEGVYLDRKFSVILSVRNQAFVVAQMRPRYLLMSFEMRAETLQRFLSATSPSAGVLVFPLIATSTQKDLLTEVADLDAGLGRIEQELHAQRLTLALGPELFDGKRKITGFRDFQVSLADALWREIQARFPGKSETGAAVAPLLETLLSHARQQALELQRRAQENGNKLVDDSTLFSEAPEREFLAPLQFLASEQFQEESPSCAESFATQSEGC